MLHHEYNSRIVMLLFNISEEGKSYWGDHNYGSERQEVRSTENTKFSLAVRQDTATLLCCWRAICLWQT